MKKHVKISLFVADYSVAKHTMLTIYAFCFGGHSLGVWTGNDEQWVIDRFDSLNKGEQCNLMTVHKNILLSFVFWAKTDSHSTTTKNSLNTQATAYFTDLYAILTQTGDRYAQNIMSSMATARAKDITPHWSI